MAELKLLHNLGDFREWAADLKRDEAYESGARPVEPSAYPCFAFAVLTRLDYGMEECVEEPRYLYRADLELMLCEVG